MQVTVLASGSKGNSVYIELDGVRLLIDAGISAARITKALRANEIDPQTIDAILLTHEHIDHVRGLKTLSKQYHLPILATRGTLAGIDGGAAFAEDMHCISGGFCVGDVTIHPFPISHDAAEPCGFRVEGSYCCTLATDLGVVTDTVQEAMEGADVLQEFISADLVAGESVVHRGVGTFTLLTVDPVLIRLMPGSGGTATFCFTPAPEFDLNPGLARLIYGPPRKTADTLNRRDEN